MDEHLGVINPEICYQDPKNKDGKLNNSREEGKCSSLYCD